jgi:hypothetical protein
MIEFEEPLVILLVIPIIIAGFYLLKKGAKKSLIISRIIVLSLLITALASPYTVVTSETVDDTPDLIIISDETNSMELFENETATELYEALQEKTSTSLVRLTGESTALGDAIEQYATGDNQIVLVTDGNSNTGEDIESALDYAREMGTTVYYVEPELTSNDLSVKIEGDKDVVIDTENQFEVVVSQATEQETSFSYELYNDDKLIRSGKKTFTDRDSTIIVSQVEFSKLGTHTLKAIIYPSGSDVDSINNEFYKAIYVIPKPEIRTIGLDRDSPLAYVLYNLYDVSSSGELKNIDDKKAIVIDNTDESDFSDEEVEKLKDYLNDGRGIVVVGGDGSYNFGDYLDSSFEEILPVRSEPTDWTGGRNVVLLIDTSISILNYEIQNDVISNAVAIINDEDVKDSYAGVIAFGSTGFDITDGLLYLGTQANIDYIEDQLTNDLSFGASDSDLNEGLDVADEWLDEQDGELEIIIISDGAIGNTYDDTLDIATSLHEKGISFYFLQIENNDPSQRFKIDDDGNYYAETLMEEVEGSYVPLERGEVADISLGESSSDTSSDGIQTDDFSLVEVNTRHFITKNIDVDGSITGYNDVTPKAGADRLVITSTGKPVLTTWRYGLGRVAALTTDNGYGNNKMWATQLYSGNNSKLIAATVNWAISNPREETGAVVVAEDSWYGSSVDIELTMYEEGVPTLKLNDEEVELSLVGNDIYEATIYPTYIGMHDLSGYPLAVNYAIEYRDVGLNEDLPSLIIKYGGETFTVNKARNNLFEEAQSNAVKEVNESVSQKIYFLIAALIIFLGEVAFRRIKEIKEMKKLEKEISHEN